MSIGMEGKFSAAISTIVESMIIEYTPVVGNIEQIIIAL